MGFQKIVLTIAIFILILCLIFIGIALYRGRKNDIYPPVVADCPDYWQDMSNGDGSNCVNKLNLGSSGCNSTMDFSGSTWDGSSGLCNKYKWARGCDLTWDGITNNKSACSS